MLGELVAVEVGLRAAFDWYASYELKLGVKCDLIPLTEEWWSADECEIDGKHIFRPQGISAVPQEKPALPSPPAASALRDGK